MSRIDSLFNQISITQNSILTWLAAALGSMIGIIELSSSEFSRNIETGFFVFLFFIIMYSFDMIIIHMREVHHYRELVRTCEDYEEPPESSEPSVSIMHSSLTFLIRLSWVYRYVFYFVLLVLASYLYIIGTHVPA